MIAIVLMVLGIIILTQSIMYPIAEGMADGTGLNYEHYVVYRVAFCFPIFLREIIGWRIGRRIKSSEHKKIIQSSKVTCIHGN